MKIPKFFHAMYKLRLFKTLAKSGSFARGLAKKLIVLQSIKPVIGLDFRGSLPCTLGIWPSNPLDQVVQLRLATAWYGGPSSH